MQIRITITFNGKTLIFPGMKITRKLIALVIPLVAILFSGIVFSATISKPYTFAPGDVVSSSKINDDFDLLYDTINSHDSIIESLVAGSSPWIESSGNIYFGVSTGNVGIGTASPAAKLEVTGNLKLSSDSCALYAGDPANDSLRIWNQRVVFSNGTCIGSWAPGGKGFSLGTNSDFFAIGNNGSVTCLYAHGPTGRVGINNGSPTYLLTMEASGGGYYSSSDHQWHNGSSEKIKQDIVKDKIDIYKVLEDLDIVNYRYRSEVTEDAAAPYHIGFIAEKAPDLVTGKNKDSMAMGDCIGLLLALAKDQTSEISGLKAEKDSLKKRNEDLESRLGEIEKSIAELKGGMMAAAGHAPMTSVLDRIAALFE
jgi:hypothetical protein